MTARPTTSRPSRSRPHSSPVTNGRHNDAEPSGSAGGTPRSSRRVIRLTRPTGNRHNAGEGAAKKRGVQEKEESGSEAGEDRSEEEREEERKLHESWAEEYYEVVEQLPLELHRTFALMRELEAKVQDRLAFVASHTKAYRDARMAQRLEVQGQETVEWEAAEPDYGSSSDQDAEGEDDEGVVVDPSTAQGEVEGGNTDPAQSETAASSAGAARAARQSLLNGIARASSEAIRAAEEKVGLAVTAYDWIDRHIRRLDGDLQRSESSLLLGLRAGTEASRGMRDAMGFGTEAGDGYDRSDARAGWGDDSLISTQSNTPVPAAKDGSRAVGSTSLVMADMEVDPNEPKYCYCDQVSSGDMVACDNEDCPREWFHYHCVGLAAPPKGRWYCLFCAPPGYKGSGTFPSNAPCLPPGYDDRAAESEERGTTSKSSKKGSLKRKKR